MENFPPPPPPPSEETTPPRTPSESRHAAADVGRSSYHSATSSDGRAPRSNKRHGSKKKEKRAAEKAAAAAQQEFLRQLTSLQLPHMPKMSMDAMNNHLNNNKNEPPTLRILVVADIDLASASALAESALAASVKEESYNNTNGGDSSRNFQNSNSNVPGGSSANGSERCASNTNSPVGGGSGTGSGKKDSEPNLLNRVDLCIACGPFCREDDLRQYYQGRQRRRHYQRTNAHNNASMKPFGSGGGGGGEPSPAQNPARAGRNNFNAASGYSRQGPSNNNYQPQQQQQRSNHSSSKYHNNNNTNQHGNKNHANNNNHHHPLRRTREETAALEGLMTAALSQLESIVCRVIFVPGRSDPITTITSQPSGNTTTTSNGSSSSYNTQLYYTKERRLTPNSRNIHRHWTALGPGLGCGGLLYLDWQKLQQPPPLEDGDEDDDDEDDDDEEDDDDDEDSSSRSSVVEDSGNSFHEDKPSSKQQHNHYHHPHYSGQQQHNVAPSPPEAGVEGDGGTPDDLPPMADHSETASQQYAERAQQYGAEFCKTLERLVQLAPPTSAVTDTPTNSQITSLLKTTLFQSILVTHFHHLEPDDDEDDGDGDMNYNGDMSTNGNFGGSYNNHNAPLGPGGQSGAGPTGFDGVNTRPPPMEGGRDGQASAGGYGGQEDSDEEEEESFDPPWPTEHEAFCALPLIQEHVILEIASGLNSSGSTLKPMELPKGKVRVVLPGSLRERGEFCLVDVAFMKDPYQPRANDYRWRVRKTRFQTINEFL